MSATTEPLPQLGEKLFITDGGLETTLMFHEGLDLPEFAAYGLLRTADGFQHLANYYRRYAELARQHDVGMVLETATWRASSDWAEKLGDTAERLEALNRKSVELCRDLRDECIGADVPVIISGCVGPRGDGYQPDRFMGVDEARDYHLPQVAGFAAMNVDMLSAMTINYVDEAIGITLAAQAHALPVCISFTVETDGRLPTGETLKSAIEAVDAATGTGPAYYQINCAHATHFEHVLNEDEAWTRRIRGVRGNASCMSHAELDESEVLDEGNPEEFGQQYQALRERMPWLTVLGGCCGTDHRHIEQVCLRCAH